LTNNEKKDYAWLLYQENTLTQKAIAERVGVTEKTITKWKEENKWESKKQGLYNSRESLLRDLYRLLENTRNNVLGEDGKGVANSKDGDAILKLSASISNLEKEANIGQIYEVCKGLVQHIQDIDLEKAKELIPYIDSFMQLKLR
jgi:transcriptional regulator with XRE-family HTH domain